MSEVLEAVHRLQAVKTKQIFVNLPFCAKKNID